MSDQHIASAFDRDLEAVQAQILKMGGLVEDAIRRGAQSLETRDEELANEVRAGDKAIDGLEEQINESAARVIALRAPTAIDRMAGAVEAMLKDALDAYIQRDADLARDVITRDEDVDQMYNALFREFLTFMLEDPRSITACMHLHFIAKNVERMGDHVTAIAEQVVYLVTGETPEDDRPKADRTSITTKD